MQPLTIFAKKLHHRCWTGSTVIRFALPVHFLMVYFFLIKRTARKVSAFGVFLVHKYIYKPEKLQIRALFTQWRFVLAKEILYQIRVWVLLTGNSLFYLYLSFSLNLVNGKRIIKTWEGFCLRKVFFSFIHFINLQKKKKKKMKLIHDSASLRQFYFYLLSVYLLF